MKLHCLVLFVIIRAEAGNIGVEGEISLKIHAPREEPLRKRSKDQDGLSEPDNLEMEVERTHIASGVNKQGRKDKDGMTVAPVLECVYQFPEEAQVHAILSNMMNQLTKMFVRASDMLKGEEGQGGSGGSGGRRRGDSRFKVVSKTNSHFFEDIYRKMTQQYLSFYNSTAVRVVRAASEVSDPCQQQQEMKAMWRELLDNSLTTFRQAAFRCIDEHLRAAGSGPESRARARLASYLVRELRKIRLQQLALLCDQFQLCYHDLLRRAT